MIILPSTFHTSLGYSTNIPQKFPLMFSLTRIQCAIYMYYTQCRALLRKFTVLYMSSPPEKPLWRANPPQQL